MWPVTAGGRPWKPRAHSSTLAFGMPVTAPRSRHSHLPVQVRACAGLAATAVTAAVQTSATSSERQPIPTRTTIGTSPSTVGDSDRSGLPQSRGLAARPRSHRVPPMRSPLALLAALASLLVVAAPAVAVTRHVDVQNDEDDGSCAPGDCSLREAVKYAPAGATIDLPSGTYTIPMDELQIDRTLTIDGADAASTTIDAGGLSRVIYVSAGAFTLRDVEVTGGNGGGTANGGGIIDTSTQPLTLERV